MKDTTGFINQNTGDCIDVVGGLITGYGDGCSDGFGEGVSNGAGVEG